MKIETFDVYWHDEGSCCGRARASLDYLEMM